MNESSVTVEAATYGDAVRDAATKLGLNPRELAIEVIDAGRSANSMGGFRPVKIRASRRDPSAPPDGARRGPGTPRERDGSGEPRRAGAGFGRPPAIAYGPPPPPLDPAKIGPELVEQIREISAGVVGEMGFSATVVADRTKEGVRVAVQAGDKDQYLIGRDGETLAALQHLVARMLRARMPEEAIPRIEVDVAGYRDRRVKDLRDLARELMEEVRQTGGEASTEPLSAIERRIVHLEVATVPGLSSMSIGEGMFKRVIVRPSEDVENEAGPGPVR